MRKILFVLTLAVLVGFVFVSCSVEDAYPPDVNFQKYFGVLPPKDNDQKAIIQPLVTKKLTELETVCAEVMKQLAEAKAKKVQLPPSSQVTPDEVKKQLAEFEKTRQALVQDVVSKERVLADANTQLGRARDWARRYKFNIETKPQPAVSAEEKK